METQTRPEPQGAAMLTEETRKTIDHWVAKFPADKKRSALIQSLIAAQEQNGGWITQELTEAVADYLDLPSVWAHEVVSFYSMFFTEPVGRHKVNICTNISCWRNDSRRPHHAGARGGMPGRLLRRTDGGGGRALQGTPGHRYAR
jgi:NADH:ubiquinone oxidoreductase subunit E